MVKGSKHETKFIFVGGETTINEKRLKPKTVVLFDELLRVYEDYSLFGAENEVNSIDYYVELY